MLRCLGKIGILFFGIFLFSGGIMFVFAQEDSPCTACNTMPENVQNYVDMMKELIELMPIEPLVVSGSQVFHHEGQRIGRGAAKTEFSQTEIIPPYIPLKGAVFSEIESSFGTKTLQRDIKVIADVQDALVKRIGSMVRAERHDLQIDENGRYINKVSHEVWEKVEKRLQKIGYLSLRKDKQGRYELEKDKVSYTIYAHFLRQISELYQEAYRQKRRRENLKNVGKKFEQTNHKDREEAIISVRNEQVSVMMNASLRIFNTLFYKNEKNATKKIDFTPYLILDRTAYRKYIWDTHDEYRCTIGLSTNMCNESRQQTRKDMSFLAKKTGVDSMKAWNTFVSSWGRLKGVFGIGSKEEKAAAKQRQDALLHSYRGADVPEKDTRRDIIHTEKNVQSSPQSRKSLIRGIANSWKRMSDAIKEVKYRKTLRKALGNEPLPKKTYGEKKETVAEKIEILDQLGEKQKERERTKQLYTRKFDAEENINMQMTSFKDAFHNILKMQEEMKIDNVLMDVRGVTQRFPALSASVYLNINAIGDKNTVGKEMNGGKSSDGLYRSMINVCNLQCSSGVGKKRCESDGR